MGLGAITGLGLAIAATVLAPSRPVSAEMPADALYSKLEAWAERGDKRAAEMVEAIDRYLEAKGLAVTDLATPTTKKETRAVGLVSLQLSDNAPWALTIDNSTTLEDRTKLGAYIAAREGALETTARDKPTGKVEAVVAPSKFVSLAEFATTIPAGAEPEFVVVDVFIGDQWIMASGRTLDGGAYDATAIERDIRGQIAASLDQFAGVRGTDTRMTVRSLRATLPAQSAARMADDPAVLLVDITDDIADTYAERAAFVEVRGMPDAFYAHARFALGVDLLPSSKSAPMKWEAQP